MAWPQPRGGARWDHKVGGPWLPGAAGAAGAGGTGSWAGWNISRAGSQSGLSILSDQGWAELSIPSAGSWSGWTIPSAGSQMGQNIPSAGSQAGWIFPSPQSGWEVLVRAAGLLSEQAGPGSGSVSPRGRQAGLLTQPSLTHPPSTFWHWGHVGSQLPCALHTWNVTVALEEHGSSLPMKGRLCGRCFGGGRVGSTGFQHSIAGMAMGVSLAVPWQLLPSPVES